MAQVRAIRLPTDDDDIAVCGGSFDNDTKIRERRQKRGALCFEFGWTEDVLSFQVPETVRSHDLINHRFTATVPNLFKPSYRQTSVFFAHEGSSWQYLLSARINPFGTARYSTLRRVIAGPDAAADGICAGLVHHV